MYREGRRRRRGGVTILRAPGAAGPAQVGVVAGRRVGGAVVRNRAKRRVRSALAATGVPSGVACIVVASTDVVDAPFDRLVEWVGQALEETAEVTP